MKLIAQKGSETVRYTIIVTGDISGDGKISASDLSMMKRKIIGTKSLDGAYFKAADLNSDSQIKASDLSKLKKMIISN